MEKLINTVAIWLSNRYGIDISVYDPTFLAKAIQKRISEYNISENETYLNVLKNNPTEVNKLTESLNISFSEFYRNPLTYTLFEHYLIPEIIKGSRSDKKKEIRIWSAACAGGQEAYTLAILFEEYRAISNKKFGYRIFATDRSEKLINEAINGEYRIDSLNNLSIKRINRWFNKNGETYRIASELRQNIDFSVFDLLNDELCCPSASIYGDFDIVVCANLLFYYNELSRTIILEKTGNCINQSGFFITGEAERDILITNKKKEIYYRSAIFKNE